MKIQVESNQKIYIRNNKLGNQVLVNRMLKYWMTFGKSEAASAR